MRRFLATFFPACFGSTTGSYGDSHNKYGHTPNAIISSRGKHNVSKGSIGFGKQHIMKTVDTIVESGSGGSKYGDEVQLVELGLPADGKMGRVTRPTERDQEDDSVKTGSEHNTFYHSLSRFLLSSWSFPNIIVITHSFEVPYASGRFMAWQCGFVYGI